MGMSTAGVFVSCVELNAAGAEAAVLPALHSTAVRVASGIASELPGYY